MHSIRLGWAYFYKWSVICVSLCLSVCRTHWWAVQKRLRRSRYCVGRGLWWAKETIYYTEAHICPRKGALLGDILVHAWHYAYGVTVDILSLFARGNTCDAAYRYEYCSHGRQHHWNIGGSQVERRRRENWGAVGGEGWGLGRGCAPSQKIYEFFISKWRDMVHSGCVVFKIHVFNCWIKNCTLGAL